MRLFRNIDSNSASISSCVDSANCCVSAEGCRTSGACGVSAANAASTAAPDHRSSGASRPPWRFRPRRGWQQIGILLDGLRRFCLPFFLQALVLRRLFQGLDQGPGFTCLTGQFRLDTGGRLPVRQWTPHPLLARLSFPAAGRQTRRNPTRHSAMHRQNRGSTTGWAICFERSGAGVTPG